MIGVEHGFLIAAQRQPGHASVIVLDELTIGLGAVLMIHRPGRPFARRRLPAARGAIPEIIEVRGEPVRPCSVGTRSHLELKNTKLDPYLKHTTAVASAHLARQNLTRLGVIGPTLDHVIQVPSHQKLPNRRSEREQAIRPDVFRKSKTIADDMTLLANPSRLSDCTAVFQAINRIIALTQAESYCECESDGENLRRVPCDQHARKVFEAPGGPGKTQSCRMFTVMSFGSLGSLAKRGA
jgi:hypothetical protein